MYEDIINFNAGFHEKTLNANCVQGSVGAGGRTRTGTSLLTTDFESVTSANSITPARNVKDYTTLLAKKQQFFHINFKKTPILFFVHLLEKENRSLYLCLQMFHHR